MSNYFRITAYYPSKNFSVIVDSNGKFDKLWKFSAFLIQRGFKIIEVSSGENIIDGTFKKISDESNNILLRSIGKGNPISREITYQDRPLKIINVNDQTYGQFIN